MFFLSLYFVNGKRNQRSIVCKAITIRIIMCATIASFLFLGIATMIAGDNYLIARIPANLLDELQGK